MTETALQIATDFWDVLRDMGPYLLFGFLMAGCLSVLISQRFIERHLGGRGLGPVVKSALFGVPLPLCSCGVIPVGASLKRHGASKAATTAFLISTPQTGVDSIMVTFSLLGGVFAIFRPLFALLSGVVGGSLVELFTRDAHVPGEKLQACQDACCSEDGEGKLRRIFSYGLLTLPRDIGKAVAVGLVIAALISALVPKDFFAPVLGGGIGAMVLMMVLGIPVYVCATASIPVAAALITRGGVSPGAAFAFLMTGPATNAATIATIWKIMGRRTAITYLVTMGCAALAGGLIIDQIVSTHDVAAAREMGWMLPGFVRTGGAIALLGVLGIAIFRPRAPEPEGESAPASQSVTLEIAGMTCSHCADTIRHALLECSGAESVQVNLEGGIAVVRGSDFDTERLREAVQELGYGVTGVRNETSAPESQGV